MFRTPRVHHKEDHLYMQFCMLCFSCIYVSILADGRMCLSILLVNITSLYHNVRYKIINFANSQQAKQIYQYNNIKEKLYKTNATIRYNKRCRQKQRKPNYISVRLNGNNRQYLNTLNGNNRQCLNTLNGNNRLCLNTLNANNRQCLNTIKAAIHYRLNQEPKFLNITNEYRAHPSNC